MRFIEKIKVKFRIFERKIFNTEKMLFNKKAKLFWNNYAKVIDEKWGNSKHDFDVISKILSEIRPQKVLDIGCGSGRLFTLYLDFAVSKIIGIDISDQALNIARRRYSTNIIELYNVSLEELDFEKNYFDLIVSNRVLQHINPKKIKKAINTLTNLSQNIYINEMTDIDYQKDVFYMFKHDYEKLFRDFNYIVVQKGYIGNQKYYLFKKMNNAQS